MSGDDQGGGPKDAAEVWDRLQALPSMKDEPLVWDHRAGGFVRQSQVPADAGSAPRPAPPVPVPPAADEPVLDPTMIAPAPAADGGPAAGRWGQGYAGAGTERRHVVVGDPLGGPAPAASASPAAAPVPPAARPARPTAGYAAPPPAPPRPPAAVPPPRSKKPRTPPPAPARPAGGAPKRRRRWLRRAVIVLVLVPLLLLGSLFAFGWYKFGQIPRAQVASALSPATGAGQNYLIVGTDSREGITEDDPNAGAFIGEKVSGARTDSIMVLRVENGSQTLLSIPRDLWVKDPKSGQMGRINATFEAGPANLIKAVQGIGIPVHHYLEINFVSFGKLVDAVGGIDVTFAEASRDLNSGLKIETGGVNHLDGTQALAYVRSRHFEELKANPKNPAKPIWVTDPTSDLGRVQRQRTFLTALMNKVTDTKNPVQLSNIVGAMSVGMKIDDAMTFLDAIKLAWKLKGFSPQSVSLPVAPRTTSGGAEVLDLKKAEAAPLLQQLSS
jgi:LCP family protein required for cell wall assembly